MGAARQMACVAFTMLSLLWSGGAQAGFVSGMDLLTSCSPQAADPLYRLKVAECHGYVLGIADTFDCTSQQAGFKWNSSTRTTQGDLVDAVTAWLRSHPDKLNYQANGLVAAALSEAFPCGQASASGISTAASGP